MTNVDEELETTQNPDQQEEELETEETVKENGTVTQSGDPLDDIQDEDARAEAKKRRAIAQRNKDKPEPKVEETKKEEVPEYVTKADMAKLATSEAKGMVSEEVLEHWDDLIEIPLAGYDKLDPKSIAKNMAERLSIHKSRNPEGDEKPDTTGLIETTVKQGTGTGGNKTKPKNPLDSKIKLPAKPEEWYGKKT